ncbi:2-dehydropantoate 2-reductase [Paramyrothecium foliicola]|nr:2-dehydropantoate 2-reductase [Paramyrothecium foliicola]
MPYTHHLMTLHPRSVNTTGRLMLSRASARPFYVSSRCFHGSCCSRRPQTTTRSESSTDIITTLPSSSSASSSPQNGSSQKSALMPKRHTAPAVHVHRPHVLPPAGDKSAPKIHILGEDERSKYLAHMLSGLQTSIELLSWRSTPRKKYKNVVQEIAPGEKRKELSVEANRAGVESTAAQDNNEPISQLLVTGSGAEAVPALEAVKHRVNHKTTVCLMSDGLGVLEDVRKRVFQDPKTSPNFLLGHMSHRLAFNRNHNAVRLLKPGMIRITDETDIRFGRPRKWVPKTRSGHPRPLSDNLLKHFHEADLKAGLTEYDRWLRFKLPSIIWDSVVEPVCVLLDVRYGGLLQNPAARHLMRDLVTEITTLLHKLPEVERSPVMQAYLDEERLLKELTTAIITKRDQPSKLAMRLNRGLPTDVDYLHGYFIRRANNLGVDMRLSVWLKTVIKARHSIAVEKRNTWVAFEEMSIPPGEDPFKYRTTPGRHLDDL